MQVSEKIEDNVALLLNTKGMVFSENITRHEKGGVLFSDHTGETRKVIKETVKIILKSLLGGPISLPIRVYEPRSFLERLTDTWLHFSDYFDAAAQTEDALQRFGKVLAGALSGFYAAFLNQKQPLNPTLGETAALRLPCGLRCFMEQVSHHPPVTQFEAEGEQGFFYLWGKAHISYKLGVSGVSGKQAGSNHLRLFAPGGETEYAWTIPGIKIEGLENRRCYFAGEFSLVGGGFKAVVRFHPTVDFVKEVLSVAEALAETKDFCCGFVLDQEDRKVAPVYGNWLTALFIGDDKVWSLPQKGNRADEATFLEQVTCIEGYELPTDSQNRIDIKALKKREFEQAQINKHKVELLQREEAKVRKRGKR